MNQSTALITGGSLGIGLELSKRFARDGYRLVLVAKPAQELEEAKTLLQKNYPDLEMLTLTKDLSEPGAADAVYQWVREQGLQIDVLINNAGFGTYGFIDEIDLERETAMVRLNVVCVYELTRLFLRDMIVRDQGKIMNIASIAAFAPTPYMTTYGATKAFVHNFTRAIAAELEDRGSQVKLISVCPTQAHSGFQKAAGMEKARLFRTMFALDAATVADYAYRAMKKGHPFVIPRRRFAWLHKIVRRLPSDWMLWYTKYNMREVE